jgi:hypothetical protein
MGYELEAPLPAESPALDADDRHGLLESRWQLAQQRLAAALAGYAALRGRSTPDDPVWLAAQLRVAQARQRCREASDDLELLASDVRLTAPRR